MDKQGMEQGPGDWLADRRQLLAREIFMASLTHSLTYRVYIHTDTQLLTHAYSLKI